ncbi:MAG TPA: UDP-N-acetylmuramoyl-L-alanine--D-glutamate ligase [Bacteroidia bacterium]|nr:UDP-N-acetylmuramoyl-L-alanine--D-glutamate ligase [Bacteroidia bacterium]
MVQENKIAVLGAGESGCGAALLARNKGKDVFVSDQSVINEKYRKLLTDHAIAFEEGMHTESRITDAQLVVKSPGIPDKAPLIQKIKSLGIPVISEIEFAGRYTNAKKLCITGTNGKTTTTLLTYHILKSAGLNVGLAGNVGQSFAMQVATKDHDYYVIELSSFQLDGMFDFRADVAVILNITPDHLDRYEYKLENYIDSKFRITQNQSGDDAFIYCADDPILNEALSRHDIKSKQYPFSILKSRGMSAYVENNNLHINIKNQDLHMSIFDLALQGKHNLYNSMAAGIAARIIDIRKEIVRESFADFKNIEHRLEHVMTVHGIEFINDSKATNVNSTWYALECMQKPVVWIVGGVDKGNEYDALRELVKEKVKAIVCLGKDNQKIIDAFSDIVPDIKESASATEAVNAAYEIGKKGDVVLLSPACASFDLFKNYEDRGWQFKKAVRSL